MVKSSIYNIKRIKVQDNSYHVMSVSGQPLIVMKDIDMFTQQVVCIYPNPEFYEREIVYFLRCNYKNLKYEHILHSAKDNVSYITKHYI